MRLFSINLSIKSFLFSIWLFNIGFRITNNLGFDCYSIRQEHLYRKALTFFNLEFEFLTVK